MLGSFGILLLISFIISVLFGLTVIINSILDLSVRNIVAENKISILKGAVSLGNESYSPNPFEIKIGKKITWINNDMVIHTVTSGVSVNDSNAGKVFDSGLIRPGNIFNYTVSDLEIGSKGTINYFCKVHPNMTAKIFFSE
ncbi:MAG: plastocyanin/azurin family copper-binding protein [Nitrososphaeraceae archaeon]